MLPILLKTLPFFALIGLGYGAGRARMFPPEAVGWLTKFVFYFALSAMLFRLAARLELAAIFDPGFVLAYTLASLLLYAAVMAVALLRGRGIEEAAVEAQCAQSGNTGFLGVPMLVVLLGPAAAGPVLMVLTVDMVVFSSLITLIITGARSGRMSPATIGQLGAGLVRNPMVVSILAGLLWSASGLPLPAPVDEFLAMQGIVGSTAFAEFVAQQSGGVFVPLPDVADVDNDELLTRQLELAEEVGTIARLMKESIRDGSINAGERSALYDEASKLFRMAHELVGVAVLVYGE